MSVLVRQATGADLAQFWYSTIAPDAAAPGWMKKRDGAALQRRIDDGWRSTQIMEALIRARAAGEISLWNFTNNCEADWLEEELFEAELELAIWLLTSKAQPVPGEYYIYCDLRGEQGIPNAGYERSRQDAVTKLEAMIERVVGSATIDGGARANQGAARSAGPKPAPRIRLTE